MSQKEWLLNRAAAEEYAAAVVSQHSGQVMQLVAQVVRDLAPETADMSQIEADIRLAGELAYRMDQAVTLPNELAEALDGVIAWFAALAAIGVWRSIQSQMRRKGERLERLEGILKERGPRLTERRKRNIERRVERLRRVLQVVL